MLAWPPIRMPGSRTVARILLSAAFSAWTRGEDQIPLATWEKYKEVVAGADDLRTAVLIKAGFSDGRGTGAGRRAGIRGRVVAAAG